MILISAALVLAAIILLIAGVVLAKVFLVMWSIVISVLSAVCLLIGALLRRHELFPAGGRIADGSIEPAEPVPGMVVPHPVPAAAHAFAGAPTHQLAQQAVQQGAPQMPLRQVYPQHAFEQQVYPPVPAGAGSGAFAAGTGLAPDAIVMVIRGRRRFHLTTCRQLVGRDVEELTQEEAREEAFTPCTTCLPGDPGSLAAPSPAAQSSSQPASPQAPEADISRVETFPVMQTGVPGTDTESSAGETGGVKNTEPVEPVEIPTPGRAGPGASSDSTTVTIPTATDSATAPPSGLTSAED